MSYDTIEVHQSVVATVNDDGSAKDEVSRTEPRWSCTDSRCGMSFAEWDAVVEHCGVYHRGPDDAEVPAEADAEPALEAAATEQPAVAEQPAGDGDG